MFVVRQPAVLLLSLLLFPAAAHSEVIKEYYPNGKLMLEMNLEMWKPEGPCKTYYESGSLMMESSYRDGEQEGPATEYYESGKVKGRYVFKKGKKDGLNTTYHENGAVMTEETWEDGTILTKKVFFESGAVQEEWDYRVTQPDDLALVKYYDKNGKLIKEQPVKKKKKQAGQPAPKQQTK